LARKTFFSFHYHPDISRAYVVRNSWLTRSDRDAAGFFDSSVFEAKRRESEDVLKRFLKEAIDGTSVTCVLVGANTAWRRWVRYELVRSLMHGSGILAVSIHTIKGFNQSVCAAGENPLNCLAFKVSADRLEFWEMNYVNGIPAWTPYTDAPSMKFSDVGYDLGGKTYHTFATQFSSYDWTLHNGYYNIGDWIESAALAAGR
jgi:hypothetical protein